MELNVVIKHNTIKHYLETRNLGYAFLDVEINELFAEELRNLYENRKLNFPTITIGKKRLKKSDR